MGCCEDLGFREQGFIFKLFVIWYFRGVFYYNQGLLWEEVWFSISIFNDSFDQVWQGAGGLIIYCKEKEGTGIRDRDWLGQLCEKSY